ncbi:MAG TPA: acyltransferase [Caulobacteraceae bacterium]|jgi:peptidoglycan/LPS O-acetylase OafA/YrhL|nr:acyltransferase [Caulobacteraceae bacterium]
MVGYYSIWPTIGVLAAILMAAATPLFRAADSPPIPARQRVGTLDGLRGFLALAVFFHHGALYHTYIQDGLWRPPPDRLYALLGPFGVAMFFMITGFLFWSQLIEKQGRPDWVRLYVGRLFRIGPIYLFAVAVMMITVFAWSGGRLQVGLDTLAMQIARWCALGLRTGSPLNGVEHPGDLLANVVWSLRYEWLFYFSLVFTAFFARDPRTAWAFPALGLALSLTILVRLDLSGGTPKVSAFIALFCVGMLTAALRPAVERVDFNRPPFSAGALGLMLIVLALFKTAYDAAPICLLGAAFFLIANGTSLFGLLTSRPARRLGDVSFGIYLLQGLILAGLFSTQAARDFALAAPAQHWALVGLAALLLIGAATLAHVAIERPGVDFGRRVAGLVRPRPAVPARSPAPGR